MASVTLKLRKSVKKLWLKALRSGEYKQTTSSLREEDENGKATYCCLDVLCDIHRKVRKQANCKWDGNSYMDENGVLPSAVAKWAFGGSSSTKTKAKFKPNSQLNPRLPSGDTLTELNDYKRFSFKRIATQIEKHL